MTLSQVAFGLFPLCLLCGFIGYWLTEYAWPWAWARAYAKLPPKQSAVMLMPMQASGSLRLTCPPWNGRIGTELHPPLGWRWLPILCRVPVNSGGVSVEFVGVEKTLRDGERLALVVLEVHCRFGHRRFWRGKICEVYPV